MSSPSDGQRLLLTVLLALWLMAYLYSFVSFALTEPNGSGFTRGANRLEAFFGWQGIAGLFAIAVFGISRKWPAGSVVRKSGMVPLALAGLLLAAMIGVLTWASLTVN
ncbi:MAG: hypothetical protein AAF718_06710 [Pseudomonadota bacterium]